MRSKLILLVDDFPESVDGLFELLGERGFAVALALNGSDGVRAAIERKPDVIVMDLAMPTMNGLEAAKILKADDATSFIPVVMYTEHAGPELGVIAGGVGVSCVLAKPHDLHAVVDAVQRLCPL